MSRLTARVNRLSSCLKPEEAILTIIRTMVEPGHLGRESNSFSWLEEDSKITSEPNEMRDAFISRVREIAGDRVVRILAEYIEPI